MVWWFSNDNSISASRWTSNSGGGSVRLRPVFSSGYSWIWWLPIITVSVPPGGAVTVVVVAYDCRPILGVVTVGFGFSDNH